MVYGETNEEYAQCKAFVAGRAGIEALREPTEEMVRNYIRSQGYDPDAPETSAPAIFGAAVIFAYQQWIEAALGRSHND